MPSAWNLDGLEVVGYANVLKANMLPSVVPPVFRLKTEVHRAFLPPYSLKAGFLYNATEVPLSELERLTGSREITLFEPFAARADFELWVDQSFKCHYEPLEQAESTLREIAQEHINLAEAALRDGDLERAETFSGVAISANDRRGEPLAIKAAIRRLQRNKEGEEVMKRLAAPALAEKSFDLLVERLLRDPRQRLHAAEGMHPGSGAYNLACVEAMEGDAHEAVGWLQLSESSGEQLSRAQIAKETNFDRIRNEPEFISFIESLEDN